MNSLQSTTSTENPSSFKRNNNDEGAAAKLLVLCSQQPFKREISLQQQKCLTKLKEQNISFDVLYGDDPRNKSRRDELFTISGLRGIYPQLFRIVIHTNGQQNQNQQTVFVGDWDTFDAAAQAGTIKEDMKLVSDEDDNNNVGASISCAISFKTSYGDDPHKRKRTDESALVVKEEEEESKSGNERNKLFVVASKTKQESPPPPIAETETTPVVVKETEPEQKKSAKNEEKSDEEEEKKDTFTMERKNAGDESILVVKEEEESKINDEQKRSVFDANTKLLVLCSQQPFKREISLQQHKCLTQLENQNIPFETLYGDDPRNKSQRDELFQISGLSGTYPQVFKIIVEKGESGETKRTHVFVGDWDTFDASSQAGTLKEDLGLAVSGATVHEKQVSASPISKTDTVPVVVVKGIEPEGKSPADDDQGSLHDLVVEEEEETVLVDNRSQNLISTGDDLVVGDAAATAPDSSKSNDTNCEGHEQPEQSPVQQGCACIIL